MFDNREHEHPGGDVPHKHAENDELAAHSSAGQPTRRGADDGQRLELREEELTARKQVREAGAVHVETDVVSERRTMDVPVTREEAYVERRSVDRRPASGPIGADTDRIDVTLHEEEVDVQKRPVVYEEVGVGKRVTQETRRVEADVRREVADVEHTGQVGLSNDEPHGHDPRR